MDTDQVSQIISQVRDLPPAAQARLLEELQQLVPQNGSHPLHQLSDLKGLGQDLWNGIDAQKYVRNERAAWNG